jgi:hypothetical protein
VWRRADNSAISSAHLKAQVTFKSMDEKQGLGWQSNKQ